jgi:hypothetical protein
MHESQFIRIPGEVQQAETVLANSGFDLEWLSNDLAATKEKITQQEVFPCFRLQGAIPDRFPCRSRILEMNAN